MTVLVICKPIKVLFLLLPLVKKSGYRLDYDVRTCISVNVSTGYATERNNYSSIILYYNANHRYV
jgi:hypothetical protein